MDKSSSSLSFYAGLATFAFVLLGCDADGKECNGGKKESNWQACNRSCTDKSNKESCARAKKLAADICIENDNVSACNQACEEGDKKSCEKEKALDAAYESKRPAGSAAPKK